MWANKNNNKVLVPLKRNPQSGFTIIETLIVLAVTSAMFVATSWLVAGQLSRYQYQSSIRQVQSLIQREINDVQSGYFPESNNVDCNGATVVAGAGKAQNCVIIGKRISLLKSGTGFNTGDTAHPTTLRVDTLAAKLDQLPIVPISSATDYSAKITYINTKYVNLPNSITYNAAASATSGSPTQDGDDIIINILYNSATTGSSDISSGDSVGLYTNQLVRLAKYSTDTSSTRAGRIACFTNGSKYGSIAFGIVGSSSVTLVMEDGRCKF